MLAFKRSLGTGWLTGWAGQLLGSIATGTNRIAARLCKCAEGQSGCGEAGVVLLIRNEHQELSYYQYLTREQKTRCTTHMQRSRNTAVTRQYTFHSVFHRLWGAAMDCSASFQVAQN